MNCLSLSVCCKHIIMSSLIMSVLQVMYEAGAGAAPLASAHMNSLDCELVPLLHAGALPPHLVLELVFHILDH